MLSPPVPLLGVQTPRLVHRPPDIVSSAGSEFVELAESAAGLHADPWQRTQVELFASERAGGLWAASENVSIVPRQNGKGGIVEILEIGMLFGLRLPLIIHSAHLFSTAQEAFRRMMQLIDQSDELTRMCMKPRVSNGKEGFELTKRYGGGRLRYLARSKGSGRGFSAPALFFDEAMILEAEAMAAILPTQSAQPNPWTGYFASAPLASSTHLHRLRARALSGDGGRLAFAEHSVDPDDYGGLGSPGWQEARRDPRVWAVGNPALSIRITPDAVQTEHDSLPPEVFDRERLGVPDMPVGTFIPAIDPQRWVAVQDEDARPAGDVVLVVDMPPDRSGVVLVAAGRDEVGVPVVDVVARGSGTGWLEDEIVRLLGAHPVRRVVIAAGGPAGGVLGVVEDACKRARPRDGELLHRLTGSEFAQSCGRFHDLLEEGALRVVPNDALSAAAAAVTRKALGDAWRWERRGLVDISPLIGASIAAWAVDALLPDQPTRRPFMLMG